MINMQKKWQQTKIKMGFLIFFLIETLKKDFQQNINRYDFTHEVKAMHPLKSVCNYKSIHKGICPDWAKCLLFFLNFDLNQ